MSGTHSLVVGLVVIISSRQVPDGRDGEASTFCRVRILLVAIVTQALKQAADDFLIVADEIGILADVVAVPGDNRRKDRLKSLLLRFVVSQIKER